MTKAELYQKACMLPLLPGVYIIRDKSDTIIYIGKAKRLRIRVSQYFREGVPHDNKVSQMIAHAYAFDVIVCQSEFEALVLEASQIKAHTPKYNILLKDDKGYSYIRVTREDWPRLSFTLQKEEDGAEYIGPYTSSFAARQMAETAMDAFLLPRCSKRFPQEIGKGRPCLNAHIGKCMAVCSGKISCETYNQAVKNAVHLIRYGKKDILKTLNERMQEASDRLEFETAALLRDQINAITKLTAGQKVVVDPDVEMDVVALAGTPDSVCAAVLRFREGRLTDKREFLFHDTSDVDAVREEFLPRYYLDDEQIPKIIAVDALPPDMDALQQALNQKRGSEVQLYVPQRGDKAHLVEMAHTNAVERLARESGRYAREEKLLDELAQVLGLSKPPRAIESYDISNWGDGSSVCGMVTFKDGKPFKAGYRKFKMKTVVGTDDYASLAETVARRAAEYEKYAAQAQNGQPGGNWFGQKPDLLLMDGGRGQVSAAKEALAGTALAEVPLFGMVKDDHHRTRAIVDSEGREIAINMNRGTFTFITAIQDSLYTLRRDVKNRAEAMNTVLDWPDRVLVISQGDDATRWYYYKYELTAKVVNGYGGTWWGNDDYSSRWDSDFMNLVESLNWTLYDFEAVCTADSLTAYMEEKQIDYLLIDRADDYLEREFSSRFEGGLKANMPATLYRFEGRSKPIAFTPVAVAESGVAQ